MKCPFNPGAEPAAHAAWLAEQATASAYDDDYDAMTVAELNDVIDEWGLDISRSLTKAAKIAALRASDAEE